VALAHGPWPHESCNPVKTALTCADISIWWENHLAEGVDMRYSVVFIVMLFAVTLLSPAVTTYVLDETSQAAYAGSESAAKETKQETEKSDEDIPKLVRSKRERRVERRGNWVEGLKGDKARIYELYGYPSGKYREEVMGTVVERWVYPEHGVTFKFKGNKLTR
jgi:hypothetical protein